MKTRLNAGRDYLVSLQERICAALHQVDGRRRFQEEQWVRPEGGGGLSRVLEDGAVLEKGGVNCSHISGSRM